MMARAAETSIGWSGRYRLRNLQATLHMGSSFIFDVRLRTRALVPSRWRSRGFFTLGAPNGASALIGEVFEAL